LAVLLPAGGAVIVLDAEPESWLLVEKPPPEEPVAFWHEYEIATDSFTSATCGEQDICGVGVPEIVEPLSGTH
jgi:hypothetical protein